MLLKLAFGPFCGVKNFFIVELNYHISNYKYLPLWIEEKEQKRLDKLQKKRMMKWKDSQLNDGEKHIIKLIHVIKKGFWHQGVPGLAGFTLAFLQNIRHKNNLELL